MSENDNLRVLKSKGRGITKNDFKTLSNYSKACKNLYNQALYLTKKSYLDESKHLNYYDLDKIMKTVTNLESEINYKLAGKSEFAQQCLMKLDKNFKSFFSLIKKYKKTPSLFKGVPRPPKYLEKNAYFPLIIPNRKNKIKDGLVQVSKFIKFRAPKSVLDKDIREIHLHFRKTHFDVYYIYKYNSIETQIEQNENTLAIDCGVNNLATCVSNIDKPFIICGKRLKSINQWRNKIQAKRQKKLSQRKLFSSKALDKFNLKQKNKINDFLHKTSSKIVKYCIEKNISNVVVGNLTNLNDKINLGKKTNQTICNIPFGQLFIQLEYKLKKHNINFSRIQEAYTSKSSFIDNDILPLEPKPDEKFTFLGKRIKRGLYRSLEGLLINADVNGALNILRKSKPKFNFDYFKSIIKYGVVDWFSPFSKCYI